MVMCVHGILTVKELHKTKKSFKFPKICTEMTYIKKTMIFIQMQYVPASKRKRALQLCWVRVFRRNREQKLGMNCWESFRRKLKGNIFWMIPRRFFRKLAGRVLQQLSYAKMSGQMRKPLLGKSIKAYMIKRESWMWIPS